MPSYFQQRCPWCLQFNRVPEPFARPAVACVQCGHQVGVAPVACACGTCAPLRAVNSIASPRVQLREPATVEDQVTLPMLARTALRLREVSAEAVYWRTAQSAFNQARSGPVEMERASL